MEDFAPDSTATTAPALQHLLAENGHHDQLVVNQWSPVSPWHYGWPQDSIGIFTAPLEWQSWAVHNGTYWNNQIMGGMGLFPVLVGNGVGVGPCGVGLVVHGPMAIGIGPMLVHSHAYAESLFLAMMGGMEMPWL